MFKHDSTRIDIAIENRRRFWQRKERVVVHQATVKLYYRGFDSCMSDDDVTPEDYERIKGSCIEALQNDLPRECRGLGLPVASATFKRVDSGSLELLFTTTWEFMQFMGNVAAFYDAIRLACLLAEKLLEKAAANSGKKSMLIEVSCEFVFPYCNSLKSDAWIDVHVHGRGGVVFGSDCGSVSAMRVVVVCLGVTVIMLVVALVWLT